MLRKIFCISPLRLFSLKSSTKLESHNLVSYLGISKQRSFPSRTEVLKLGYQSESLGLFYANKQAYKTKQKLISGLYSGPTKSDFVDDGTQILIFFKVSPTWFHCANRRTTETSLSPSYSHLIHSEEKIKFRLRLTVLILITNPNSVETAIVLYRNIFLELLFHKKGKQIICVHHMHLQFLKVPPLLYLVKFYILLNVEFLKLRILS